MKQQFVWVNLFELAKGLGYLYFEAYVDRSTNKAVGWINRTSASEPYDYICFFAPLGESARAVGSGPASQVIMLRGTWQHARWSIQGLQQRTQAEAHVPMQTVERAIREKWGSLEFFKNITVKAN